MTGLASRVRLGLVLAPDRVTAAVARGGRVTEAFSIVGAEHPAETLRAELEARGVRARSARLALHRTFVTVKPLSLPAAAEGDLREMVRFELERHLPFSADDAAFDFVRLPQTDATPAVLVAAAERRVVERATQLLAETKIRPVSLSVAAHDLVLMLRRRRPGQHVAWAHRAGDSADLMFLDGAALVLSRSVPVIGPAELSGELRGSLSLLRWTDFDALWVSGDDAERVRDSDELRALGVPLAPPALTARARRALGGLDTDGDGAALLAGAVAIGGRGPSIDLLPRALRPRRLSGVQKLTVAMVVVAAALGVGALLAPQLRDQRVLRRLDAEIRSLDSDVRRLERIMGELERERQLLDTLQSVRKSSMRPLPFLRELTDLLPTDAWLTALTLDQRGAELTGQAAAASALIPLLENSPRLEHVELVSPVTRGREMEQFRLRGAWETLAAGARAAPSPPQAADTRPPRMAPAPTRPPAAGGTAEPISPPSRPASPRGGERDLDRPNRAR